MPTEPDFLPPNPEPEIPVYTAAPARPRSIPNFGHMALFLVIAGLSLLLTELFAIGIASSLHFFPHESVTDMAQDARLILPTMFLSYFIAALLSILIFTAMWRRPFAEGIRWDLTPIRRHGWLLFGAGIALSIVIQVLSNFLPIPKELPIDKYFKTPLDVYLIAFFGIFIAPAFEELTFRGFLLPALANTWDYLDARYHNRLNSHLEATHFEHGGEALPNAVQAPEPSPITAYAPLRDPAWSVPALIFASTATSIGFAFLHADQLAHAYAPLAVLFCVSLVLCFIRLRWHSLAASTMVHACYNGTIFALLFFATDGFRHLDKLKQ